MAVEYEYAQKCSDKSTVHVDLPHINAKKGPQWFQTCSPQYLLLMVMLVAAIVVSLTTLVVLLTKYQLYNVEKADNFLREGYPTIDPSSTNSEKSTSSSTSSNYPLGPRGKRLIVSRAEWLASPPNSDLTHLRLPVPYVIIMHTATENCSNTAECIFHVQAIQRFHVDNRGWNDIGYSFLVGGDGNAYEGRGWENVGAQVYGYNSKCIGIAFIGTFNSYMPPEKQIVAAKQLIKIGIEKGYIAKDYKLLTARQLQTTQSPGLMLYEDIKKWPHWAEKP